MLEAKQVILVRTDIGMTKGKLAAQCCHASLGALLSQMSIIDERSWVKRLFNIGKPNRKVRTLDVSSDSWINQWLEGPFVKICLKVGSEQELRDMIDDAELLGIPTSLITDSGRTQFNGVPTVTCGAIGPFDPEIIDEITGDLKLL